MYFQLFYGNSDISMVRRTHPGPLRSKGQEECLAGFAHLYFPRFILYQLLSCHRARQINPPTVTDHDFDCLQRSNSGFHLHLQSEVGLIFIHLIEEIYTVLIYDFITSPIYRTSSLER